MKRKYYQITTEEARATIDIYGDITSFPWLDSDVAAYDIKKEIDALDVNDIDVYINSYGGEVAEALAICTALRRNKAAVHTYCDGFACSAASVIFAAGDTRSMGELSLLMIHNCMSYVGYANSEELRKAAEDNDKINQSSIKVYDAVANIGEEKIKELMNAETWITAKEALDWGFATEIVSWDADDKTVQSAFGIIKDKILQAPKEAVTVNFDQEIEIDLDELAEKISAQMLEKLLNPDQKKDQKKDPEEKQVDYSTFFNIFK